jgi:hypothetical protein
MNGEPVRNEDLPGVDGGLDPGYYDRLTVLDAFLRNPRLEWTPEGLSAWYGIRVDLVRRVLVDLQARRIIRRTRGRKELYMLRRPLRAVRALVRSRAVGPAAPGPSAGVPSPAAEEPFANEP